MDMSTVRTDRPTTRGSVQPIRQPRRPGSPVAPVFWMTVLAIFVVLVGVAPAAGDPVPSGATAAITVRVSASDTLWTIAAAHRLPGLTTAQMVAVISEINSATGEITPGTALKVPVDDGAFAAYAQAETLQIGD
jgi:Tfp pilus assembly protein FimV